MKFMRKILILLLMPLSGWAQSLQENVEAIVRDEALRGAVLSICVRTADGRTLVDIGAEKMVVPASNMKLISTGAALHELGSGYSFETGIAHDGKIENGTLKGNLYIVGGGDPTTGSKDSIAVAIDRTFGQWAAIVRKAGIKRIHGHVIGDGRYFGGMAEHPTWLWNDIGTYYGAGATGLMFYENMQSFSVSAGAQAGDSVKIRPSYPDTPWMEFRYDCLTGGKGTGDRLYMYTSDLAPVAEIRGTFGVDRAAKRVDCSNKFPEYTCAAYFTEYLDALGIKCTEGAADFKLKRIAASDSLKILGSVQSPQLRRIVFTTNHASNNLYAETLYRTLGKVRTGNSCYDSSAVALNAILRKLAVSTKGANIVDGSGLSRQNYISADFFCRFLGAMMKSPCFGDYLASIPSPGSKGTLAYNMSRYPTEMKARIKVKSGSMNGIRCYSGYILPSGSKPSGETPSDNRAESSEDCLEADILTVSIMINNCTAPSWKLRQLSDKIMAAIAAAN